MQVPWRLSANLLGITEAAGPNSLVAQPAAGVGSTQGSIQRRDMKWRGTARSAGLHGTAAVHPRRGTARPLFRLNHADASGTRSVRPPISQGCGALRTRPTAQEARAERPSDSRRNRRQHHGGTVPTFGDWDAKVTPKKTTPIPMIPLLPRLMPIANLYLLLPQPFHDNYPSIPVMRVLLSVRAASVAFPADWLRSAESVTTPNTEIARNWVRFVKTCRSPACAPRDPESSRVAIPVHRRLASFRQQRYVALSEGHHRLRSDNQLVSPLNHLRRIWVRFVKTLQPAQALRRSQPAPVLDLPRRG
jgi:hypothetical protein